MVVMSYLFSTDTTYVKEQGRLKKSSIDESGNSKFNNKEVKFVATKLKTCFVESFKFAKFNGKVKEKKAKVKAARLLSQKRRLVAKKHKCRLEKTTWDPVTMESSVTYTLDKFNPILTR